MSCREALKIWKETTWGTFPAPATPVKGTDYIVVDLDQANAATVRARPNRWTIRSARGCNRKVLTGSGQTAVGGGINTILHASQAQFWLTGLTDASGATGDLPSYTIDHYIRREDAAGSITYRRYLGCKFADATISAGAEAQLFRIALNVVGKQPATIVAADFPAPPDSDFPTDPYVLSDLTTPGTISLAGTVRTEMTDFSLSIKNILDATFRTSPYVSRIRYCGRDVEVSTKLIYETTAERAAFEDVTAMAATLRLDNGAKHVIFDLNDKNFFEELEDDLDHGKVFDHNLKWSTYFDGAAGTDFSVSYGTTP